MRRIDFNIFINKTQCQRSFVPSYTIRNSQKVIISGHIYRSIATQIVCLKPQTKSWEFHTGIFVTIQRKKTKTLKNIWTRVRKELDEIRDLKAIRKILIWLITHNLYTLSHRILDFYTNLCDIHTNLCLFSFTQDLS
jgi:hypothetical protein